MDKKAYLVATIVSLLLLLGLAAIALRHRTLPVGDMRSANSAYSCPEGSDVNNDTVSLHVRWDRANSTTADCAGQYCLITIPKGCTATDITLTHNPG